MNVPQEVQSRLDACTFVCGSDECGYGSWAGPLIACAAIVPVGWALPGVTDSKKLTKKKREALYGTLLGLPHGIQAISADEIDHMGMAAAWEKAHLGAIEKALFDASRDLKGEKPLIIIDGVKPVKGALAVPKADLLIPAVSAASIIGKVYRDRLMVGEGRLYPKYGFDRNSGYGTKQHQEALKAHGVTPIHRKSYRPIRDLLEPQGPVEKPLPQDLVDFLETLD